MSTIKEKYENVKEFCKKHEDKIVVGAISIATALISIKVGRGIGKYECAVRVNDILSSDPELYKKVDNLIIGANRTANSMKTK